MRVLLADSDTALLDIVRRTLEAEGHQVRVARTPEAVAVAAGDPHLDVVLLDAVLARTAEDGCVILRDRKVNVFITTPLSDGDATIRKMRDWFGGAYYLRKPFSVLDLPWELSRVAKSSHRPARSQMSGGALFGRMSARAASAATASRRPPVERANRSLMPRADGPVVFQVAERLAGAWLERFTGLVRVRSPHTAVGRPLALSNGGLVDTRDTSIVDIAVRGAQLQFVPDGTLGPDSGDRQRFIQVLWAAVYQPSEARFAEVHAFEALELSNASSLTDLGHLVSSATRSVLALADGARALGEVVVGVQTTPAAVSADLQALSRLGLIRFTPPATRTVDRRRTPEQAVERDERPTSARESRTRTSRPRSRAGSGPGRVSSRESSRRSRSSPRLRDGSSRSTSRRSGHAEVAEHMRRAGSADAVQKRLQLEVQRLTGASAADVLGIPADSSSTVVAQVGARMRDRYQSIADDRTYSDDTRALARQLLERVEEASARWGRPTTRAAGDPGASREAVMLEQSLVLLDANAFARADRVLTAARERAMTNPKILAALGWARFNNPERPEAERQEEGRDYLLLAEQFDSSDVWTEWALVKVFRALDDPQAALVRAKLVLKADPSHLEAEAVVRQLTPTV